MNYKKEPISEQNWSFIRACSDILRTTSAYPTERAINCANSNFLLEIGESDDRGELDRQCVFVSPSRSMFITLCNAPHEGGKYQVSWKAWEGIQKQEITALNNELIIAFAVLYGFPEDRLVLRVIENPHLEIPKDTLIETFDICIKIWCDSKRIRIMDKYGEELTRGKKSLFKWRFYLTRWRGLPKYEKVEAALIRYMSAYLNNPGHMIVLLQHLDEGGEQYCEDTKRVLAYIRTHGL